MVKIKTKKIKKIFGKALYWAFFAFLVYLIFELIRIIFGGSLGFEEAVMSLLVANLGFTFYNTNLIRRMDSKLSGHIGWHKGKEYRR